MVYIGNFYSEGSQNGLYNWLLCIKFKAGTVDKYSTN
jgi:hypothetical protein